MGEVRKFRVAFPLPENPDDDPPLEWMSFEAQDQTDEAAHNAGLVPGPVHLVEISEGLVDEQGHYVVDENGVPLMARVAHFSAECRMAEK